MSKYREPRQMTLKKSITWTQYDIEKELERVRLALKERAMTPDQRREMEGYARELERMKEGTCPACKKVYKNLVQHIRERHDPKPPRVMTELLPGASMWDGIKETGRF